MREKPAMCPTFNCTLQKLSLDEALDFSDEKEVDLLSLDEALQNLAEIDEQQSKIVEQP